MVLVLLVLLRQMKGACLRDPAVQLRRREARAVLIVEQSRTRKEEKKKKAKQSNMKKVDKKDGYARGGLGH